MSGESSSSPAPSVDVRVASREDIPFLVAANQSMATETEGRTLDPEVLGNGVTAVFDDGGLGFYLVAQVAGAPAACLMITREWSDWRNGPMWWIQSVFVHPEYRRQGLYRSLHEEVLRRAAEAGDVREVRLYVDRDNGAARTVYEKLGMQHSHYDLMEQEVGPR